VPDRELAQSLGFQRKRRLAHRTVVAIGNASGCTSSIGHLAVIGTAICWPN
jgi:hypothetical protein